ncbi:MAG: hypothetical protein NTV98_00110, partial [Candidatus Roizmanbacteria bacterium]|nr:hypothetical protein [Candidatus Roizmanbacteria bacterium]
MGEKPIGATYQNLTVPIVAVLERLSIAQEQGIISPRGFPGYEEAVGLLYDRSNRISKSKTEKQALRRLYGDAMEILQDPRETGANATSLFETLC